MNDVFEKRVRAAAVAGWWTLLIAAGFITLVMGHLSRRHVGPTRVAPGHVGAGCGLGLRAEGMVLGHRVPQVQPVADGVRGDLADAVGEAVAKAGRWTLAKFFPNCSSAPSPRTPRTSTSYARSSASRRS